jgi:hypothetical protein
MNCCCEPVMITLAYPEKLCDCIWDLIIISSCCKYNCVCRICGFYFHFVRCSYYFLFFVWFLFYSVFNKSSKINLSRTQNLFT